jgi:monoamine oxidase
LQYLKEQAEHNGAIIQLSTVVKDVKWYKGLVEVLDETHHSYTAHKLLITVPVGVLKAGEKEKGAIRFIPELEDKKKALQQLGYGDVIKILLQFNEVIPVSDQIRKDSTVEMNDLHMILSDKIVPTWWTQHPDDSSLLTGWLSGPKAASLKEESKEEIRNLALDSLAKIFGIKNKILEDKLQWWKVFNWSTDPFTRGSYSYSTLQTNEARQVMITPVENTLYFAGEALYDGPEMGTVEAALESGKEIAGKILNNNGSN